jgi:hypothetical protein
VRGAYLPEDGITVPTHQQLDARSLAMHCLIAEKISRNPALFERVTRTLRHWRVVVCTASQPYLQEWETLVAQGLPACLAMATQNSEHAAALRQSSPFTGILTHQERFAFLKSWSQDETH